MPDRTRSTSSSLTLKKEGEHGQGFTYKTVNTDALGLDHPPRHRQVESDENLSDRIWSKLGAEQDAYFTVDLVGNEFAGGGLNAALRDFARFGEMIRNGGMLQRPARSSPKAVIDDIRKGAQQGRFRQGGLQAPAGLELPQHVVGHPQRARRLHGPRRARAGDLYRSQPRRW
jgi:CubicO group peptidase (beta-lactamase class C family)